MEAKPIEAKPIEAKAIEEKAEERVQERVQERVIQAKPIILSALDICMALQGGELEVVQELLPRLQEELPAAAGEQQLAALKNVLSTALRKRSYELVQQLLEEYKPILLKLMAEKELAKQKQDFLSFLVYYICDRRLVGLRPAVQQLVVAYTKHIPSDSLAGFWNEWTSLTARIARRGWQAEVEWLLSVMLRQLWRCQDVRLWHKVLLQLEMQLTMSCRFASLEAAFAMYKPLFYSFLFVTDYAAKRSLPTAKSELILTLMLRGVRDCVNQIARGQMLEQQEVYNQIYALWMQAIRSGKQAENQEGLPVWKLPPNATKRLEQKAQRFLQMVITYWSLTNPKSSKRQMDFLEEVMEPWHLSLEDKKLLRKLS